MAITCCTNTASQIRTKIAEINFSKIASSITSGLEKSINFPVKALNHVTVPLSRRMVDVAFNLTGERYQRYCQTRAFSLANNAMNVLPEFKDTEVFPQTAEAPASGCVEKSRKILNNWGKALSSAASSMDDKAEQLTESKWMGIRVLGHGVRLASYPLEGLSYVPSGLSQVGEKVKDIPWASRPENEGQRVIADKIYTPLVKNIDRAISAKQVQMSANLTAGYMSGCALSKIDSYLFNRMYKFIAGDFTYYARAYENGAALAYASTYAWIGAPVVLKAVDVYKEKDQQILALRDKIVEKNPRLTEYLSKIDGLELSAEQSKALLTSLVGYALDSYETKLGWLDLSDAKTIDTLCSFPPVNLPVAAPAAPDAAPVAATVDASAQTAVEVIACEIDDAVEMVKESVDAEKHASPAALSEKVEAAVVVETAAANAVAEAAIVDTVAEAAPVEPASVAG